MAESIPDLSSFSPKDRVAYLELVILCLTPDHPHDLARATANAFGISRQTAHKYIRNLVEKGLIEATGKTRARTYTLRNLVDKVANIDVTPDLEEDRIWRDFALASLPNVPENVREICHYGFTEIVNNVIDHSESVRLLLHLCIDALNVQMRVIDYGVGIFSKIQNAFHLEDPRHALLELSKGKLTTDPERHTGEGIYFSSRIFDEFSILSGELYFSRRFLDDQWLIETEDREAGEAGTSIRMAISRLSSRELGKAFAEAASEDEDFRFSRTHVPVNLARYGNERLVSRSQAKRVLTRFERFSEVLLDFDGVETIGQAFADEIFRVFRRDHPTIDVISINTNPEIDRMIQRAQTVDQISETAE